MNSSASAPPPPPPSFGGNIPSRRLPTQLPAEPPACVQNAMLTKDKKPFTYTPGGIDLSQIKSPRMAQRLERNKNSEGVTNQPRPSQPNNNAPRSNGTTSSIAAMGTPVQVFPSGPPAPPPPPPKNQLAPQSNGAKAPTEPRKSPQIFEPPPMGCRPEIKIPPNPMANLKPTPKPQEKNDFWVEEYRKERSKSPNVNALQGATATSDSNNLDTNFNNFTSNTGVSQPPMVSSANYDYPKPSVIEQKPNISSSYDYQRPSPVEQKPIYSDSSFTTPTSTFTYQPPAPVMQSYKPPEDQNQLRQQTFSPPPPRRADPPAQQAPSHAPWRRPEHQHVESPVASTSNPVFNRPMSPLKPQFVQNQRATSPQRSTGYQSQHNQAPSYYQQANTPNYQQASTPSYQQPNSNSSPNPLATNFSERNANVGTLYIPPVNNQSNAAAQQKQTPQPTVTSPQTPAWLARKQTPKDTPEWVNNSPEYRESNILPSSVNNTHQNNRFAPNSTPMVSSPVSSHPKERIISIQLEKTPTPTKTPMSPGFGGQTFFNNQQMKSYPSPGYTSPTNNPNKFVDQGYDDFGNVSSPQPSNRWTNQQTVTSSTQSNYSNHSERVIPIQMESRGPTCSSPVILQSNPRTLQHQNSWGSGAPNQSKSFRVLQKITDTSFDEDDGTPGEMHEPQYSKTLEMVDNQLKRTQLTDNERLFLNRVKSQGPSAGDPTAPPGTMYKNKNEEQPRKYVHPSEQKVYEPKKYMGGNIPSRSFKILQAMTMPENAGPGQSDM